MNTTLTTLAIVFPVMVPTVLSLIVALLLIHLAIRTRPVIARLPAPKLVGTSDKGNSGRVKAGYYHSTHCVYGRREGVEL